MKKEDQDITLRDVVKHIQAVRSDMQDMERRLSKKIDANTEGIKTTKKELGERIDALDEDLTATIQDTMNIRRHVGMPVASE